MNGAKSMLASRWGMVGCDWRVTFVFSFQQGNVSYMEASQQAPKQRQYGVDTPVIGAWLWSFPFSKEMCRVWKHPASAKKPSSKGSHMYGLRRLHLQLGGLVCFLFACMHQSSLGAGAFC
jgi:hypothetical protein